MEKLIERYAKIPRRQRFVLVGLIVVGLVAGYWYFYHADDAKKVEALDEQYKTLENERAEKQAYVDNLAKYEARLNELQQDLNAARAQLPDSADEGQFLAQLGNRGRQSGLLIEKFEPKGETPRDFVSEIAFGMAVRGSYHEIGTFIDALSKLDRIVNVTGISMDNPKTENQKVVVTG
ncbi:MAG: type 4a pilus biogenesis protein PilO, partial [Deltaproteobacteria bacterium]|nr:type 4a pilus biogenesis protein PilO [Deltaproteobacteria bacterium]